MLQCVTPQCMGQTRAKQGVQDTCNPVDVGQTIGDDTGMTNVSLKGVLMIEEK